MASGETHCGDAKRLLEAFEHQARLYEQLLERCGSCGADPMTLATEAAQVQQGAREIQDSVKDVLEKWAQISCSVDADLRVQIDAERHRIERAMLAVLSQHEDLLGELAQQQPGKTDATVQVRLPTEDASDLS